MVDSRTPPPGASEPSIGQLVGKLTENFSTLVRDELQLAQAQLAEKGKAFGVTGALFAVAGVFALFGLGWLLTAAMFGLATALPYWAAALIVAGVVLLIAAIAGLAGRAALKSAPSPQTKENVMKDIEAIKAGVKS
ncbi:phage holin family protein [Occultella kanbiaonis]|uniref:phage holin family protein n=1 Tax=Occultella kanbiaonis TaxID=2675754 RepID=UPI0013D7EF1C|nr:phage holin family protein [Occultella kanbiaonis]